MNAHMLSLFVVVGALAIAVAETHGAEAPAVLHLKDSTRQAALGEWSSCSTPSGAGTCIDTGSYTCSTTTLAGLCPGSAAIRCCPPSGGIASTGCSARGGLCKRADTCTRGSPVGTVCPGPSFVQCCVTSSTTTTPSSPPGTSPSSPPTTSSGNFLPPAPSTSGSTGSCVTAIDKLSGVCIPTSACTGGTFNGLCSGSSSIRCCVAETRPVVSPSARPIVSLQSFGRLFENISPTRAAALWPYFLAALDYSQINTCRRVAAFVAQVGHESVGLLYFEEIASGAAYEGRTDLGNTQPGDGKRYKGRGPIQLTGRSNYRSAGTSLSRDFEARPEQVSMPSGGFVATAYFWKSRNLNTYADSGDFNTLTRRINGGLNGLSDRTARWNKARAELGC